MKQFDLVDHLIKQNNFSEKAFGPRNVRGCEGVISHIKEEIAEIEEDPKDLMEWIDLIH